MLSIASAAITRYDFDAAALTFGGAVYDSGGTIVPQSQRTSEGVLWRPVDEPRLSTARPIGWHPVVSLPNAAYLGHFFSHFGHFLIETLPTFICLDDLPVGLPLIFHPFYNEARDSLLSHPHVQYCLDSLGVSADRLVFADRDIAVDDLRILPRPYRINHGPVIDFSSIYRAIRDRALSGEAVRSHRRIYLSRGNLAPSARLCVDEGSIETLFEDRGFTVIFPEQMSFHEQVLAAAHAEIIAGIAGSALHLSVFMQAGARAIVLGNRKVAERDNPNYETINRLVGVETISVVDAFRPTGDAVAVLGEAQIGAIASWLDRVL